MGQMRNSNIFVLRAACLFLLSAFCLAAAASGVAPKSKGPFKITKVGLDKKAFNPSKGETVSLDFEITGHADVEVVIYDRLDQQVWSSAMPALEAGRHSITWDGRRTDGKLAPGNVFLYVIETKTGDGRKTIYNMAQKTGGFEVKSLKYTLDKKTGKIEYVLPKTCMVRIRVGLKDGMFTKSIFDWEPHTAGRHSYEWDGKDDTGQMNLLEYPELELRLTCYTLPANTIISTGAVVPFEYRKNPTKTKGSDRNRLWATKGKYLHYQHDPRVCHQPRLKILFPTQAQAANEDIPVVSGVVPIRVELDPRDARHLIDTRFEIMFFIDGVFIYEIEEGLSPSTFSWDTTSFVKGPHILTVNIIGYDDHIGNVSRKVIIGD
jgi:flagellar hook assembly protein FlgD